MDVERIQGTSDMKKIRDLKGKSAAVVCQQLERRHGRGTEIQAWCSVNLEEINDCGKLRKGKHYEQN